MRRKTVTVNPAYPLAFMVILVWGVTFVSTRVILLAGLSPGDVLFYRTFSAWACLWLLVRKPLFAGSLKDEASLACLGLFGGTCYFLFENTALSITQASNVALIVCTVPLMTAVLNMIVERRRDIPVVFFLGTAAAYAGVGCIVYSGAELRLNPVGDLLALCAAFAWSVYSLFLKKASRKYPVTFITRKVFFYTIVTLTPYFFIYQPLYSDWNRLVSPKILLNILFLGVVAQTLCLTAWNFVVQKLGPVRTNVFIYLQPLTTMVAGILILDERLTVTGVCGTVLIIAGVFLSDRSMRVQGGTDSGSGRT